METMNEFVGSRLTSGAFHQMSAEIMNLTTDKVAILKIDALAVPYQSAIATLGTLINRVTGYAETAALSRADVNRDALFNSLYYAVYYLRHLDPSHPLTPQVSILLPIFAAYKGSVKDEMTKQTSEIEGLISQLSALLPTAAIKALGLLTLVDQLDQANAAVRDLTTTRTDTAATRTAATPQISTEEARTQVVDLYRQIVARVNAVAQLESKPEVTEFISKANAVAAHYSNVMANQAKTQETKVG